MFLGCRARPRPPLLHWPLANHNQCCCWRSRGEVLPHWLCCTPSLLAGFANGPLPAFCRLTHDVVCHCRRVGPVRGRPRGGSPAALVHACGTAAERSICAVSVTGGLPGPGSCLMRLHSCCAALIPVCCKEFAPLASTRACHTHGHMHCYACLRHCGTAWPPGLTLHCRHSPGPQAVPCIAEERQASLTRPLEASGPDEARARTRTAEQRTFGKARWMDGWMDESHVGFLGSGGAGSLQRPQLAAPSVAFSQSALFSPNVGALEWARRLSLPLP